MNLMNKVKNKGMTVIMMLFFFLSCIYPKGISVFGASNVVTVTNNILTNQTTSVVGNPYLLYSGTPYSASTVQEFKNALDDAISNCYDTATINYTGPNSLGSLSTVLSTLVKDVMQTAGHDYEKHILYQWSFSYTNTSPQFTATYSFYYLETKDQRDQVDSKVNDILSSIITGGMSDEQKEKAINDYIISTVAYDTTLKQHSAYAALFGNQRTVCQGYALLAYKMLTKAGLAARIVTGTGNNVAHAWNMVNIKGNWYQLDTTWNDPVPDVIGRVSYMYFNLTDAQLISRAHKWDMSPTYSYYPVANTQYVTTDSAILAGGGSVGAVSTAPDINNITVNNNYVGTADKVTINGLKPYDIVKIYKDGDIKTPFITKAVGADTTCAAITIPQLGQTPGSIYVSVTSVNKFESTRAMVDYDGEPKVSTPSGIAVAVNNVRKADTINVTNVTPGSIIVIYKDMTSKKVLATKTVPKNTTGASISISQLGSEGGEVYLSLKRTGFLESDRAPVEFDSEQKTTTESAVVVVNNFSGISSVMTVKEVSSGDIIKIYDNTGKKVLAKAIVKKDRNSISFILPKLAESGGVLKMSLTSDNKLESDIWDQPYDAAQ